MNIVLLMLAVVVLVWFLLKPDWLPAPPEKIETEKIKTQAVKWADRSSSWVKENAKKVKIKHPLGGYLKAWLTNEDLPLAAGLNQEQVDALGELTIWINSLSAKKLDLIGYELEHFCKREGVDIRWLLMEDSTGEMQKGLAAQVMYFLRAYHERELSRPSAALRAWQSAPLHAENKKLGNQLFVKLVENGMASVPADLLLAPEKARVEHQVKVITELIKVDRDKLLPIVAAIIDQPPAARPAPFWKKLTWKRSEPAPVEQANV